MPRKDPEKEKEYWQSPSGKKSSRISNWKRQGIIVDDEDWDYFYDYFLSVTDCHLCKKELTEDKRTTHSTRCVDHDHAINDRPNVRMICCNSCNSYDKSTNTSGEPNIIYWKDRNSWRFQKIIQGKKYGKSGFKTKEEAINYKHKLLASTLSVKET